MKFRVHVFLLVLTLACVTLAKKCPLARISLGHLRGTWRTSARGKQYAAFTSVPYAKPPVGPRRFEPPEPLDGWHGEWNASHPTPTCMAYSHLIGHGDTVRIKGQEDCLYLNVYTPRLPKKDNKDKKEKLLDVIVYIHGGAFMFGESRGYGPSKLVDRDVVFVTINYRLGPLGFLSLDDPVQPGNHGMRDQVAALQWIQDHISAFSGDPNSVTITGGSAGGASVHYHYLSPLSQGLFTRGISSSGSALCRWALSDQAKDKSIQLAASVGCPTDKGAHQIIECLKQRPAEQILEQVEQFQVWQYSPFTPFGPVVETAKGAIPPFLPDWPVRLLQKGDFKRVPWMTGVTTAEGLYPAGSFVADEGQLALLDRDFTRLVPHLLDFNFTVPLNKQEEVSNKIRQHYLGDQQVDDKTIPQIIKMIGDRLFVVDVQRAAEIQSKYSPVYFYQFDYRGKHSLSDLMSNTKRDFGVSHADDMSYVMDLSFIVDASRSGMEKKVEELFLDTWTSFAKKGAPKIDDITWRPVSEGGDLEILHIDGVPPSMIKVSDLGDAKFWESLPLQEPQQNVISSHDEL